MAGGFFSPSGVRYFLTDSYVMKFNPTFTLVSAQQSNHLDFNIRMGQLLQLLVGYLCIGLRSRLPFYTC